MSRHPRAQPATPTARRMANRLADIAIVERTGALIVDLGADLDRRLEAERRPTYRMRMLRESTNRITRAANDAVQAYARVSRALRAEEERPEVDAGTTAALRTRLDAGRATVLHALEDARRRYELSNVAPDGLAEPDL